MNAWCAEWGSRIKFFFSELYFRTWCGNSGRIAADFYLHPSEIPDAFMVLHCALCCQDRCGPVPLTSCTLYSDHYDVSTTATAVTTGNGAGTGYALNLSQNLHEVSRRRYI